MSEFSEEDFLSIIHGDSATPEQLVMLHDLIDQVVPINPSVILSQHGYETEEGGVLCFESTYAQLGETRPADVSMSLMAPGFIDPPLVEFGFTDADMISHIRTNGNVGSNELFERISTITEIIRGSVPDLLPQEERVLQYLMQFARRNMGIVCEWDPLWRDEEGRFFPDQLRDLLQAKVSDFVAVHEDQHDLESGGDITVRTYQHYGTEEGRGECPSAMLTVADSAGFDREQLFFGHDGEHEYIAIDPHTTPVDSLSEEEASLLKEFTDELDDGILPKQRADELIGELMSWKDEQLSE